MNADVQAFLADLPVEARERVSAIRARIHRTIPQAVETIAWGSLSYHRPEIGGRVKGAVCQIVVKRGQVRLDFIHGIHLSDPTRVLQGRQVSKRYVVLETVADAERPEIAELIREAATLFE